MAFGYAGSRRLSSRSVERRGDRTAPGLDWPRGVVWTTMWAAALPDGMRRPSGPSHGRREGPSMTPLVNRGFPGRVRVATAAAFLAVSPIVSAPALADAATDAKTAAGAPPGAPRNTAQ